MIKNGGGGGEEEEEEARRRARLRGTCSKDNWVSAEGATSFGNALGHNTKLASLLLGSMTIS